MRSAKGSGPASVVGLDIEPGRLAAVEVGKGPELAVQRAATASLEPGVIRDGEVGDPDALREALRALWAEHKLPKRVRIGVANQRIVVRTVDLPPLEDAKELAAAVRFQAQDHIPMPLDQAVLEHQSAGMVDTPEGRRARVVLVAARRDMVERFVDAVQGAGLRPVGVDLSAFAMIRALGPQVVGGGTVLIVSVGGVTNLVLSEEGRCLFTRVVPGGTELLAQQLAERRQLTVEQAHATLREVGLEAPVSELDGDPDVVGEARDVLDEGVRRIGDEIRNSLDFFRMQHFGVGVDRGLLTGPAVAVPGFAAALSAEIGLEIAPGLVSGRPGAGSDDPETARLAVAAGLAVGRTRA